MDTSGLGRTLGYTSLATLPEIGVAAGVIGLGTAVRRIAKQDSVSFIRATGRAVRQNPWAAALTPVALVVAAVLEGKAFGQRK